LAIRGGDQRKDLFLENEGLNYKTEGTTQPMGGLRVEGANRDLLNFSFYGN